ncbi:MAG: histidine kinase, partial [Clostridia bacterium]|nr:histidine kinase [Clostridia bacterium]
MGKIKRLSVSVFLTLLLVLVIPFTAVLWYVKADMEAILRDEISAKVVQNLQMGENSINQLFARMTNISNVFYWDQSLMSAFTDPAIGYYERYTAFSRVIRGIAMQNLYEYRMDDSDSADEAIRITFIDRQSRLYASWSMNYQDYSYLAGQDFVKEAMKSGGFMCWSMDALGYQPEKDGAPSDQIALARAIIADSSGQEAIGTLLISVAQSRLTDILENYRYSESDVMFAASGEQGLLIAGQDADREFMEKVVSQFQNRENGNQVVEMDSRRYLLTFYTVDRGGLIEKASLKIFCMTDYQNLDRQITGLVRRTNLLCAGFAVTAILVAVAFSAMLTRPMRLLSAHMAQYQPGDEPVMLESGRRDEINDIYAAYYDMSSHIKTLFERLKAEQITKEKYYYESLRSRITPHFLFNTLNSIRWMAIIRGADNIRESIDALAGILTYSLEADGEMVTLDKELAVVSSYCLVQNMRFGNVHRLLVDVPDEIRPVMIIRFILQPAVENCFKHAFKGMPDGGCIVISARVSGDDLTL